MPKLFTFVSGGLPLRFASLATSQEFIGGAPESEADALVTYIAALAADFGLEAASVQAVAHQWDGTDQARPTFDGTGHERLPTTEPASQPTLEQQVADLQAQLALVATKAGVSTVELSAATAAVG